MIRNLELETKLVRTSPKPEEPGVWEFLGPSSWVLCTTAFPAGVAAPTLRVRATPEGRPANVDEGFAVYSTRLTV